MKLVITDKRKISEIQGEFNSFLPYLKMEFFSKSHGKKGASPKEDLIPQSKTIGQCRKIHKDGQVTILPSMTVSNLEELFRKNYGLFVQVFRKSGKLWLETTLTDEWTLEEQNTEGEELSRNT